MQIHINDVGVAITVIINPWTSLYVPPSPATAPGNDAPASQRNVSVRKRQRKKPKHDSKTQSTKLQ